VWGRRNWTWSFKSWSGRCQTVKKFYSKKTDFERQPQGSPGSGQQDLGKLIWELKEELKEEPKSTNGKLVSKLSKLSEKLDKVIVTNDKLESNMKQLQNEN
jgi:hypothetical protein